MGALILYVLMLGTAFAAGRWVRARWLVGGVAAGAAGVPVTGAVAEPAMAPQLAVTYLVFVVLPLAAGAYRRQHVRLLTALRQRNAELRRSHALLAEQERLRERLRIARDMHDALGHRLGLVSMRAAAIEVGDAPPEHRAAVAELATQVREVATELHTVVGDLRADPPSPPGTPSSGPRDAVARERRESVSSEAQEAEGWPAEGDREPGASGVRGIDGLVERYRRAGGSIALRGSGPVGLLSGSVERAAYRVIEEGLTNASKHAPGAPVSVTLEWEDDTLLLSVENPAPRVPAGEGYGLRGLDERLRPLGGAFAHRWEGGRFRLTAMLPTAAPTAPSTAAPVVAPTAAPVVAPTAGPGGFGDEGLDGREGAIDRVRSFVLGAATAAILFGALPAAMMLGVR
ncbi:sensor histidine kinase [Cryptosporangium sp. NPDC051539]|uniref:sensor histidine kinase n=1 Tax=Cryptosporangium sp. NPDC051539 TaxID=3363962 RepID=UPI00378F9212